MVQYLLSVHSTEADVEPSPEVMKRMYAQVDTFNEEIKALATNPAEQAYLRSQRHDVHP
jgi:hypothetical protein